jgi:hypothetical protein
MMSNKLSQLRTLYGDFARSYKYVFEITPNTTSSGLVSLVTSSGVNATPVTNNIISNACINCVMPNVGSQEISVEVGMHTMRLNGRHETGGTITPEFLLAGDYGLYRFIRNWAGLAASHSDDTQHANNDILSTITITAYNVTDVAKMKVQLQHAWCRNCPEITFSDDSNDIVRFSPEFVYEWAVELPIV